MEASRQLRDRKQSELLAHSIHRLKVLVEPCYECHNSIDTAEGELPVDWRGGMLPGGSPGASVMPGKPKTSLLLKVLRHEIEGLEMPEGGPKLSNETIDSLSRIQDIPTRRVRRRIRDDNERPI